MGATCQTWPFARSLKKLVALLNTFLDPQMAILSPIWTIQRVAFVDQIFGLNDSQWQNDVIKLKSCQLPTKTPWMWANPTWFMQQRML